VTVTYGSVTLTAAPAAVAAMFGAVMGFAADEMTRICSTVEKWFVNNKFRVVASDGTILITVQKNNTIGIQELAKHGLDITKLTHLSKDGNIVNSDL
jgi:hypothetical protein